VADRVAGWVQQLLASTAPGDPTGATPPSA
jgi:hypothetical protein